MNKLQVGDIVIFRGEGLEVLSGKSLEGRVVGINGDQCAIEEIYQIDGKKPFNKPQYRRNVYIRAIDNVIKDETRGKL